MTTMLFDTPRPLIVGVLNLTPDSFSDGAAYPGDQAAVDHALRMIHEGADIIDIGGESTRPGAARLDTAHQLRRVIPVIRKLRAAAPAATLSIDTTRHAVAQAAVQEGASVINDISAGVEDPEIFALAARHETPLILMHMQGQPATMQAAPRYGDVVAEVRAFLLRRAAAAQAVGVRPDRIAIDPGIGFGKTAEHNLQLIAALPALVETGYAVMLGASRKGFLGRITGVEDPAGRDAATAATTAIGVMAGVKLLRVHDVRTNRHAADVAFAVHRHLMSMRRPQSP